MKQTQYLSSPHSTNKTFGIPDPWLGENHYARELIQRLFAVADAARNYYEVGKLEGIEQLEARLALRWALKNLDEGDPR